MASSGISSPRASLDPVLAIVHGKGLGGPSLVAAVRRYAATAALIVLLMLFRSFNLCVVAVLGLAPFLTSRIGAWIRETAGD